MTDFKKCLLTGGSGLLGKNLLPLFAEDNLLYPSSSEMNICDVSAIEHYFISNPDIDLVVHAAAYTDVKAAEKDYVKCNHVNVVGTHNLLSACAARGIKFVFISTDAVFDGSMGMYETTDPLSPVSKYAKSKTAAELLVRTYDNSLIIRTSFFDNHFPYEKAFIDQWTSKDYIDIMAPKIFFEIKSNKKGISHVSSNRRTLYELAKLRKPDVIPCKLEDVDYGFKMPIDLSLKGDKE